MNLELHFVVKLAEDRNVCHLDAKQLKSIAEFIKPKRLISIHTDKAKLFKRIRRKVKIVRAKLFSH
jgi:hypothetical protein